ncbi:MAG: glycosyltransferase family 2 protein [Bacteroidia bacterium]|nr:glycosyltransferase family 2 protein [Bacteroidia bacterium]MDW8345859.1 glycosyltransferase family 2 protein [Bacteroidia bacterium]
MDYPLVSVVILNYNGRQWLEKFLPFCMQTTYPNIEWLVVDNASTDDSVSYVVKYFPTIKVIQFEHNKGFAKGNNDAILCCAGEYIVLLNSDVEVTSGWLEPLVNCMQSNNKIAAVQPKVLSYYQRTHFEYAGACGGFLDMYGVPFCRGRIFEHCEEDKGQYDQSIPVFWATGACMLIRKSAWHKVGEFDEFFFAHMEEIDWCWRAKSLGYEIWCEPKSVIYHVGGGTLSMQSPKKTYLNFRNSLLMLYKNLPKKKIYTTLLKRLILDGIAGIFYLTKLRPKHIFAIIKAHWHFFAKIPKYKHQRNSVQLMQKNKVLLYPKSIIFLKFIKGRKTFTEL